MGELFFSREIFSVLLKNTCFAPLAVGGALDWKCNWFCLFSEEMQFCAYVSE